MKSIAYTSHMQILYLESDVNYTIFHLMDGKKIISSTTLKKFEVAYSQYDFLRINKSSLVNPSYISRVEKNGKKTTVTLLSGIEIMVSRRKNSLINGIYKDINGGCKSKQRFSTT